MHLKTPRSVEITAAVVRTLSAFCVNVIKVKRNITRKKKQKEINKSNNKGENHNIILFKQGSQVYFLRTLFIFDVDGRYAIVREPKRYTESGAYTYVYCVQCLCKGGKQ